MADISIARLSAVLPATELVQVLQNEIERLRLTDAEREAVDAAEKLAGLNRWIPVDEKPPKIGLRVLGLWMSHKGAVQSVRGAVGGWIDDNGNVTAPPTHWMPLPEPPEVK